MFGTRSCLHLDIIRKLAHYVQKVADPCNTELNKLCVSTITCESTNNLLVSQKYTFKVGLLNVMLMTKRLQG